MPARGKIRTMTEDEYLRFEEKAKVSHEFVDGHVFAMSGSTQAHNVICGNVFAALHGSLRGGPCQAYANDMKLKISSVSSYYYPDIMVSCEPFEAKSIFKHSPVLVIEILSPSTMQIDRREKLVAYQKIASLKEYVIIYQDRQRAEVYRRGEISGGWEFSVLSAQLDLVLESLPNGPLVLSFSTIYEGYNPPSRVQESEGFYDLETEFTEFADA